MHVSYYFSVLGGCGFVTDFCIMFDENVSLFSGCGYFVICREN